MPSQLTYTHAENFFALLKNRNSYARINFPRRLLIEKSYDEILLYFKQPTSQDLFIPKQLNIPGQVTLSNGSILQAENVQKEASSDRFTHIVAVGQNDLPLSIRTRQPGDRMSWRGLAGRKKIKDIFIDEKVPRGQRDQWPIVVTKNGAIIWLIGLKKGQVDLPELMNKRWIKLTYKQQ